MNIFVTIFLGLVVGPTTVELQPPAATALVRLFLDHQPVAELKGSPWQADVDFGEGLSPHLLVAQAMDRAGTVTAESEQWINLPSGPAKAGIELVKADSDQAALRLRWAHVLGHQPRELRLTVGGVGVEIEDPAWVALPTGDQEIELVRLEVEFPDFSVATADVVLRGGELIREDVELTAIPIRHDSADRVGASFRGVSVDGRSPRLLAVERGPAQIIMVVDPAVIGEFGERLDVATLKRRERRAGRGAAFAEEISVLEDQDWVRFVWPMASDGHPNAQSTQLFDYSRDLTRRDGSLVEILRRTSPPHAIHPSDVRLADAVAVAGLLAASRSRRRGVVLVTEVQSPGDLTAPTGDRFTAAEARSFLAELRVPLLVWAVGEDGPSRWGEVQHLWSPRSVERAISRLRTIVDDQRVAWISGLHLPQEILVEPKRSIGDSVH